MKLRTRKILSITFVLAFLIITPLVSFYAAGYSIFRSGKIIQKTGMFALDSYPEGARISIDGQPSNKSLFSVGYYYTPAKIKNLQPGEHLVTYELDGYTGWSKKLVVKPGESTYAENVNLFKKSLPINIINDSRISSLVEAGNQIAAIADDKVYFFNPEKNEITSSTIVGSVTDSECATYSAKDKCLALGNNIIYTDPQSPTSKIDSNSTTSLAKFTKDGDLLYSKGDKIVRLDLGDMSTSSLITIPDLSDFHLSDNLIYAITYEKNTPYCQLYSSDGGMIRRIKLPNGSGYRMNESDFGMIYITNSKNDLLIIDPYNFIKPIKKTIPEVTGVFWISDDRLIYTTGHEIFIDNISSGNKTLLLRLSDNIKQVYWHQGNNNIIYLTDKGLYSLEMDDRDGHIQTEILSLSNIQEIIFSSDSRKAFFTGEIGRQKGLFELVLQ